MLCDYTFNVLSSKNKNCQTSNPSCSTFYLDWSIHVGLFDAQNNLPSDSDAIEEVVDETDIVYEGVNVTGAQHQQSGNQLNVVRRGKSYFFGTWGGQRAKETKKTVNEQYCVKRNRTHSEQ